MEIYFQVELNVSKEYSFEPWVIVTFNRMNVNYGYEILFRLMKLDTIRNRKVSNLVLHHKVIKGSFDCSD